MIRCSAPPRATRRPPENETMQFEAARKFALSLPDATEAPHHELWSFRVGGKIFATGPTKDGHLHIFVADDDTRAAVAMDPRAFAELFWGRRLAGVRVTLAAARAGPVRELLVKSWRRKASKRAIARFDAERPDVPPAKPD